MRGNIESLPKWAQQEISRLAADLKHANARLEAGPENSNVFADPYGRSRPLGTDTIILFQLGERPVDGVTARIEGGTLQISGSDSLSVQPRAANSIAIKGQRWGE